MEHKGNMEYKCNMEQKRQLTCIVCPMGCRLSAVIENCEVTGVTGNKCKRGVAYAKEECVAPKRVLTSTVRVDGGIMPRVPVKTDKPVPKELISACMEAIHSAKMKAPINAGDIVIKDILGLGINIIATRNIDSDLCY